MHTFLHTFWHISSERDKRLATLSRSRNRRTLSFVIMIAIIVAFVTACTPDLQPLHLGAPVWHSGESSQYQVTNSEGIRAGTAQLDIQAGGGRLETAGWTIRRQIAAGGQTEDVSVQLADPGYRPQYSRLSRTDEQGQQLVEAFFKGSQVDVELTNRLGSTIYQRVSVPSNIRDERTLLTIVRTLPLAERYATQLNSFLPITGLIDRVTVQVTGSEQVEVPAGRYDTWAVALKMPERTTKAWIAKEAPYPVVKFIDGRSQAMFELTAFQPGRE